MHASMLLDSFPSIAYVPAGQCLHGCPASAYLFASHMSQLADGFTASFPAGQSSQPDESFASSE